MVTSFDMFSVSCELVVITGTETTALKVIRDCDKLENVVDMCDTLKQAVSLNEYMLSMCYPLGCGRCVDDASVISFSVTVYARGGGAVRNELIDTTVMSSRCDVVTSIISTFTSCLL